MKHVVVGILTQQNEEGEAEYLLVSSEKPSFGEFSGAYYPPGGHVEEGESEREALIREIQEELGLTVLPLEKITESSGDVANQTTHWWTCEVVAGTFHRDETELADARFFSREQMKSIKLWPATEEFFTKYIFQED